MHYVALKIPHCELFILYRKSSRASRNAPLIFMTGKLSLNYVLTGRNVTDPLHSITLYKGPPISLPSYILILFISLKKRLTNMEHPFSIVIYKSDIRMWNFNTVNKRSTFNYYS